MLSMIERIMRNVVALIFGVIIGGYAVTTMAVDPVTEWKNPATSQWEATAAAAAAGWATLYPYTSGGVTYHVTSYTVDSNGHIDFYYYACNPTCGPVQHHPVGYQLLSRQSCPAGYTWDDASNSCLSACVQGTAGSASWWNGCFDVDGIDNGCDAGSRLPYPINGVCDGSCVVSIAQWTSCQFPVTGGGPIVCSGNGTLTGASCQPGDNFIPPNSQKCPSGYAIGTVNGQSGCYKSGPTDPVNTTTTQSTDPQTGVVTTTTTTTNTTNNTTTTTTTVYNPATNSTTSTQQTSPLDPNKPMFNDKAPGEDQNPYEIDETGTPTDGSLSQAKSDFETAANAHKTFIDGLASQGNHGMVWDWSFELPSGTCSPYAFTISGKSFTLDPCEKLGMVRDVLGFLIYITTALALLSIATGYGKEGK